MKSKIHINESAFTNGPLFLKDIRFETGGFTHSYSTSVASYRVYEVEEKEAKEFSESDLSKRVGYKIECEDGVADWGNGNWITKREKSYQF